MLLNNWYVAAESEGLKDTPLGVRMLGADFVVFRGKDGRISCLSAVCCHRGASLAAGKVTDGCVACPYHGWRYDTEGRCVAIPALGDDAKIPKRARVDHYPVREMFGWIWVFLGDAPESERPPFHAEALFPEYFDEKWRSVRLTYEMPVNWQRSEENAIDGAHPTWVHKAFGTKRDPKLHLVEVRTYEWGASTTRERTPPAREQKVGRMREITKEKRGKTRATTEFHVCGITNRTDILRSDGLHQVQLAARTPIDELNTRLFFIQARDYMLDEEFEAERIAGLLAARDEDVAIVEIVKPPLTPPSMSDELLVESDQLETAFRKKVRELADRGWEIDSDTVERESKRRVYVIPCPDRRIDSKNWVHRPVPTTQPRQTMDEENIGSAAE